MFLNWDIDMYYEPLDRPFECRALNINEDLGQIEHVFSDKTGTLTENQMVFRCCTVNGTNYLHEYGSDKTGTVFVNAYSGILIGCGIGNQPISSV